jgi:NAD-dependent dihydropyrimidine dehydrogenase PreA subunit
MVCWMAPFMILGRKLGRLTGIPSLHLVADNARCISCSQCTRWCPMSIDVLARVRRGDMEHPDCILCGACADICPQKVIRFEFSPPNGVVARPSDR